MQQTLKPVSGATRAQVIAAQLLDKLDVAVNETLTAFHLCFEGNDFRRLRVMSKAGEVVEIAMLAHGTPPSKSGLVDAASHTIVTAPPATKPL
jgi:hypothetical protein